MISYKDKLIKNLHKLYREDPYINELFNSVGISLNNLTDAIIDLEKEFWFDTMTSWGIENLEKDLAFKTNPKSSIEDRRSQLQARWISNGKTDLALLQNIANSWKNGEIDVKFVNGKIQCTFSGEYGIPKDIDNLKYALEEVKPAHLAIIFAFKFLYIRDIDEVMTLSELETKTLNLFAFEENEIDINSGNLSSFTNDELSAFTYNELTQYLYGLDTSISLGSLSNSTNDELSSYTNYNLANYTYGS